MENKLSVSERTVAFVVPAGAGAYAPEILYLNRDNRVTTSPDEVGEMQLYIASLPASATVEVDLLAPGESFSGTLRTAAQTYTANGLTSVLSLAGWRGVRIRVKSGGTGGTATLDASWW
jgi:hypothetical protein